jgi:hypothetical protein
MGGRINGPRLTLSAVVKSTISITLRGEPGHQLETVMRYAEWLR